MSGTPKSPPAWLGRRESDAGSDATNRGAQPRSQQESDSASLRGDFGVLNLARRPGRAVDPQHFAGRFTGIRDREDAEERRRGDRCRDVPRVADRMAGELPREETHDHRGADAHAGLVLRSRARRALREAAEAEEHVAGRRDDHRRHRRERADHRRRHDRDVEHEQREHAQHRARAFALHDAPHVVEHAAGALNDHEAHEHVAQRDGAHRDSLPDAEASERRDEQDEREHHHALHLVQDAEAEEARLRLLPVRDRARSRHHDRHRRPPQRRRAERDRGSERDVRRVEHVEPVIE